MALQRVLITGAAGNLGRVLRQRLRGSFPVLRVSDRDEMAPAEVGEVIPEDLAEPREQLGPRPALERVDVAIGPQERLLDQVRGASLGGEVGVEAAAGDDQQVIAA